MAATVNLDMLEIRGASVSGVGTCLTVPEFGLVLDMGLTDQEATRHPTVLLTHAHMDHVCALPWHADVRQLMSMKRPRYVVPPASAEPLWEMFEAWSRLCGTPLPREVVPLGPGEELSLPGRLVVRPFETSHRVPSQGYGIWRKAQKLKDEYHGLAGEELRQLRERGVQITEQHESRQLAYTGDTTADVLQQQTVRKARRLIIEATFLDDRVSVEHARSLGHLHLQELADNAHLLEHYQHILLTHFSARYGDKAILAALDDTLPPGLRERVTALLPSS